MKNKKSFIYSLLALFLGVAIAVGGTAAMVTAADMIPDHKNSTVSLPLPEGGGVKFLEGVPGIDELYPLNLFQDGEVTEGFNAPLESYEAMRSYFVTVVNPKDNTAAKKDGFICVNVNDESVPYRYVINEDDNALVGFSVPIKNKEVTSAEIDNVYNKIIASADAVQKDKGALKSCLSELNLGSDITGGYTGDPITDFFYFYCSYSRWMNCATEEAQYIYLLLTHGSYAAVYSGGAIYLTYTISDFGSLTLSWSISNTFSDTIN
ncbi:MAG: hypothetical protein IKV54_01760, partial [Clostridia bacterium]|nr:hypothetical protein [Clostridia bacterium]